MSKSDEFAARRAGQRGGAHENGATE